MRLRFSRMIQDNSKKVNFGKTLEHRLKNRSGIIQLKPIRNTNLIRELNFNVSGKQIVNEHIREEFDDKNEVYLEDVSDTNSIEEMIDEGLYRYKKDWNRWSGDKHVDEIVCVLVAEAIRTVMEYSELEIQFEKKRGE